MRTAPLIALVALATAPLATVAGAQDFENVEITHERIAEGVYMLRGAGGNVALVEGPDALLMIDDEYKALADRLHKAVSAVSTKPIRYVVNTHWHFDHAGGNERFVRAGAVLVAQDAARARLAKGQYSKFFDMTIEPAPPIALPAITFAEGVVFHVGDETARVFHVPPAHTDGDAVIQLTRANVIHAGDVFFNGMYPFIDLESGGSVDGVIAAVEEILAIANSGTKIIPGHGPLASRKDLVAYRDMLEDVRARIGALVAAGKSVDEVQAAHPTAAYDAAWGNGFLKPAQFVSILYAGLAGAR